MEFKDKAIDRQYGLLQMQEEDLENELEKIRAEMQRLVDTYEQE